jgi:phosphonate transport system substrate-binding protein
MLRRNISIGLISILLLAVLAGCGPAKKINHTRDGYEPKELRVLFRPSQNAETMEAKSKPLEKLLSDELGIPVKVTVSTNFNIMIEALDSKQVDVAFLTPTAYVLAHNKGAAEAILQSQRYDIKTPTGQQTDELVDSYRAMLIVKTDSDIKTIEDLKGKKMGWQNVTSSAGYVWPAVELKRAGIDPDKDVRGVTLVGFDMGVISVLNGDVDVAAVYEDARNLVKNDYPDVFNQTRILYVTQPIPNDAVAVRPDMSQAWKDRLQNAFINLMKNPEGYQIMNELYIHEGYSVSDDSHFDLVREYDREVGQ